MNMLAKTEENRALSIADYEARIYLYKEQIGTGYIGIGRTLIEAKEAGVVPHGEWEEWVTRVTGLNTRQAQRCMQAAREIKDGSALAKLEMSKALMLLSSGLGEDEQEAVAQKAADEGQSVKALKEEIRKVREEKEADLADAKEVIKRLKIQIASESGAAAEMKEHLRQAKQERSQLENQLRDSVASFKQQMNIEKDKAYRQGARDQRQRSETEAREDIRKEYESKLTFVNGKNREKDEIIQDLQSQVKQIRTEQTRAWDTGFEAGKQEAAELRREIMGAKDKEIDDLQQALDASEKELEARESRVAALQAELEAAEKREAKRAEELSRMKKEKAQTGMDAARGIGGQALGTVDLAAAVRSFIGTAGVLPQMGNLLTVMTVKEREQIRVQVETVARWVTDSRKALGVITADASIQ